MKNRFKVVCQNVNERRKVHDFDKAEFEEAINEVIANEDVRRMIGFNHHSHTNCFKHSLHVAYYNYKLCKFFGLDAKAAARAGMLHDLFLYDWHERRVHLDNTLHGFSHPYTALHNAKKNFELSDKEQDIIEKHMFPLTPRFPKYKETVIIILTDKFCSVCEVMDRFFKKAA